MRFGIIASVCIALCSPVGLGLPCGTVGSEGQPTPSVERTLEMVLAAYSRPRVVDAVTVEVWTGDLVARDRGMVMLAPRASTGPRVRLELGDLVVTAIPTPTGHELRAIHARDEAHVWISRSEAPLSADAMQRVLPPMMIPQLWLTLGTGREPISPTQTMGAWEIGSITTLAPDARWFDVVREREDGQDLLVLIGRAGTKPIALGVDAVSGRLRRFQIRDPEHPLKPTVRVIVEPIEEGQTSEPDDWALSIDGRAAIGSMSEFRPRERRVRPGEPVGRLALSDVDGNVWSMGDPDRPEVVVLIAARASLGLEPLARAALDAKRALVDAPQSLDAVEMDRVGILAAMVYDAGEFSLDRFSQDAAAWHELVSAVPLSWTTATARIPEAFVPGAGIMAAVIDAEGRLIDAADLGRGQGATDGAQPDDVDSGARILRGVREAIGAPTRTLPIDQR